MNKMTTSTPKPKNQFKIVITPGADGTTLLKMNRGNSGAPRINDLQAAVNSITNQYSPEVENASKATSKKLANQAEKIVFLPKYFQKRVNLIKTTPKKQELLNRQYVTKVPAFTSLPITPTKKTISMPGSSGTPAPKKRKLGDLALETWGLQKSADLSGLEAENGPESPSTLCRVCGSLIEDSVVDLVDQSGSLTRIGLKLKAIVGTDVNDCPLYPPSCCKPCSYKVNVCYSLLAELQASDGVVRTTYADLQEGDLVNPGSHIYTCQDCDQEVVGMKEFIHHCEGHIEDKTIGPQPKELRSGIEEEDEEGDNPMMMAQLYLEEVSDDGTVNYQNDLGEFVCEICGRTFKYLFLLQLHRKAPKRKTQEPTQEGKICFVCKSPRPSTLSCKLGANIIPLCQLCRAADPCPVCTKSSVKAKKSKDEPIEVNEEYLEEEEEEEEEDDDDDVETEEESPRRSKSGRERVECDVCGKMLLPTSLAAHKLSHKNVHRFYCDLCSAGFNYKCTLRKHLESHEKTKSYCSHYCHICMVEMPSGESYRQHMDKVHDICIQSGNIYFCPQCSKPFDNHFMYKVHMLLYHRIEMPHERGVSLRKVQCHVCKLTLKSENAARIHMRRDHNLTNNQMESLKLSCEECGKAFSVKQNLINHVNSAHLNFKPMTCDMCGERFGKHSSLIFHKLRHTGEKPFQCCVCLKTHRQRNDVMRHLARHVRDKEIEYEAAYAINTSDSKYISKRQVFLKDSTIKGLRDVAMCSSSKKKRVKSNKLSELLINEEGEILEGYEEVIIPEGAILMDDNQDEGNSNIQYLLTDDGTIIVKEEQGMEVEDSAGAADQYEVISTEFLLTEKDGESIISSPNGGEYVFEVNEHGVQSLVRIDEK